MQKLRRALQRLSALRASWDERVAFFQWIMRGVVGYVPLVGLPQPSDLHAVDAAFHNLVLAGMGVHSTVERMSLLAAKSCGGMQLPSVVESILAAAGADLLLLLSGRSEASVLARDALRDALNAPPVEAEALGGLVVLALRLLAAYGFHVCVQPDRFTARVLNALPCPSSQPLVGSFRPVLARPSLMLARVGFVANSLRRIFAAFVAEGRPRSTWSDLALWSHVLPAAFPFSPAECSLAVAQALAESQRDWRVEYALFRPGVAVPPLPEDWGLHSWEDPCWASADPRTFFLDAFVLWSGVLLS